MADEASTGTVIEEASGAGAEAKPAGAEAKPEAEGEAPAGVAAAPAAPSWREQVTDSELRKIADRFAGPQDAMKAIADLRKRESTSIRLPGKNATDEERGAYRKAIGVPEKAADYALSNPEGREPTEADKAFQTHFSQVFHRLEVPTAIAKGLNEEWNRYVEGALEAQGKADAEFATQTLSALQQEWGNEFERNKTLAARAATELFGKEFDAARQMEMKDGRLLLDHPMMLKLFANVGSQMSEGTLGPQLGSSERSGVESQIDDLQQRKMTALSKGDRRLASRLDAEQQKLYERVEAAGPIVGAQSRTA